MPLSFGRLRGLPLLLVAACVPDTDATTPAVSTVAVPAAASVTPAASSPPPALSASAAPVASAPAPPPADPFADAPPRVYAKSRFVWVHYQPSAKSAWLGFLWLGGHADLKSTEPVPGKGGCSAWYEVKPAGYVCVDKDSDIATLDPHDPVLEALRPLAAKKESPWPHHYGESRGVERYTKLPTVEEQRGREFLYDEHLRRVTEARAGGDRHASLEGVDLTPGSPAALELPVLPATLREQRRRLNPTSTVAWSRDIVDASGRSWLLTADFTFVPKDRVAPYPVSDFRGFALTDEVKLPVAFFREKARPQHAAGPDGRLAPNGQTWPRLAHVALTGQRRTQDGVTFLEVEGGLFVDARDAVVPTPQPTTPWGAPVGADDTTGRAPKGRQTWLEISILGGWMIAYEGTRPVYVTMVSPGRGGLPTRGVDPVETAATPVGSWPVTGKFVTATMVAPHEFIHSDVPWTQNFHGPHAIHVAYWHDGWGEKKSAGCVNVSPLDGKWLFDWTEPSLPDGWHGMRWDRDFFGPATQTVLHD